MTRRRAPETRRRADLHDWVTFGPRPKNQEDPQGWKCRDCGSKVYTNHRYTTYPRLVDEEQWKILPDCREAVARKVLES